MKKFNQVKIVLFDSTIAQFKLSVEAVFTRSRQDGGVSNLAYVTDKGLASLNPSIYLVFSYKGATFEETKNLYTSYPQLFRIRKALDQVRDLLEDNKGFIDVDGVLTVNPSYQDPVVVANIGKQGKWMSISLAAIDSSAEGDVAVKIPGVTLQLSDSDYASVLTAEEILTIYSIVKDIDLTTIQVQLSSLFLMAEDGIVTQPVYQQPQYQQTYQPQPQVTTRQSSPRYGQNPITRTAPVTRTTTAVPQKPAPVAQTPSATQTPSLPPRKNEKQIINIKDVEETAVSHVSFDDSDAISDIFNDEN